MNKKQDVLWRTVATTGLCLFAATLLFLLVVEAAAWRKLYLGFALLCLVGGLRLLVEGSRHGN